MSLFTTIFGPGDPRPSTFPDPDTCPHDRLLARYRNRTAQLADQPMGYKCQTCDREFLPFTPEAQRWRAAHPVAVEA